MTTTGKVRQVGVDLQDSEDTHGLVDAIEADNPGAEVTHMPGLIRVTMLGELVIRRDSVAEQLGRDWETHEFQLNIVSYFGTIAEWDDDKIVIKWEH
jgi:phenol/toluene 2-monooxygenase (NADH) P2/A2